MTTHLPAWVRDGRADEHSTPCVHPTPCALVLQYMAGELKVDEFITHRFPLTGVNDAFHVMHEGVSIRAVLDLA